MALETLKGITEIGGFKATDVNDIVTMNDEQFRKQLGITPIVIDHDWNVLMFKLQDKPIGEAGVNGCQVETIIEAARLIIEGLDEKVPCHENEMAINKLQSALNWLRARTKDRRIRGVEGTDNE